MTSPVLLIADHKWRDLPSLALLKVVLEDDYGVPARIVNYTFWDAAMLAFKPSIVCPTTQTGPREQAIARVARASGAMTVVIPTEGVPTTWKVMPVLGCRHVDLSNVDRWLTWNDVVRDYMLENTSMTADRIVTTGANRFDFYHLPFRRLLATEDMLAKKYGLPERRPLVTWATNFAHAAYALAQTDFIQRDWEVRGLTAIPGFSSARAFAEGDLRSMRAAQAMMKQVFAAFPDVNFLLKIHPAERLDLNVEYVRSCHDAGLRNVALVSREYIGDLLNRSSAMLHRSCTTGLEAWILGVPTMNLRLGDWHDDPDGQGAMSDAARVDHPVSTAADIIEGLRRYLGGGGVGESVSAARRAVLQKWLAPLDGRATERQADAIVRCLRESRSAPSRNPVVFGAGLLGASKRLTQMALNVAAGRSFDLPLRAAGGRADAAVDPRGFADRFVMQHDVEHWCHAVRHLRKEPLSSPCGQAHVPAVETAGRQVS